MMWTPDKPYQAADHIGPFNPERILYEFDEPLIFTARMGLSELLFLKVSEIDGRNIYLATHVYQHVLEAVNRGTLSLRGAMESGPCFVVEMENVNKVAKYWECRPDEIPEDFLPERGVGLIPGAEWVADTFEQIDAFFSVRFSGQELKRDTMSFQTFKNIVDNVYDTARRMFAPVGLEKAKSATFDFRIHEPIFGSLIITIDNPEFNLKYIRRHLERPNITKGQVNEDFSARKNDFFRDIGLVVGLARNAELSVTEADEHIDVLGSVIGLLPGEGTKFTKVEFNGEASGVRRTVVIEEVTANRLRLAHELASGAQREITGKIKIINANSNTFVVEDDSARQLTCHLDADKFDILLRINQFRSPARVKVVGRYYRRARRDYMKLDHIPKFI